MKIFFKIAGFLGLGLMVVLHLSAQPNITKVEYFVDTDPGYGNATALPITAAANLPNLSFSINIAPLAQGVHVVGVRSQDANGAWSLDSKWFFLKPYATATPNITKVEYFVDTDPGYGKATDLPVSAATDLPSLGFIIDISTLAQGVHVLGVRSKDANGAWSLDSKWFFLKPYATATPNITKIEYFVDTDPGYGKATDLPVSAATDLPNLGFAIDISTLSQGVHVVGVRSKDANGAWSLDSKWFFLKPYATATPNITKIEYFVDTDPGYGKATDLPVSAATDLPNLGFAIDISTLSQGVHVVGVRSKDANGAWSLDSKWFFLKPSGNIVNRNVSVLEYYFDNDPGYGKGVHVSITPATDINSLNINTDLSGLAAGKHSLVIRSQDDQQAWSLNYVDSFALAANVPTPVIMLYFKAQKIDNEAKLTWATSQEINSKVFFVQRSTNGTDFSTIGSVKAAGNSSFLRSYNYNDDLLSLSNSVIYYRLEEVDIDGSITYSNIAMIEKNLQNGIFSLLQNPVKSSATLLYNAVQTETVTIALSDINGKLIYTKVYTVISGSNSININLLLLSKGTYLIQAINSKERQTFKLIKE